MKDCRHRFFLIGMALYLLAAVSSRANVYATNIKLNGTLTNSWVAPGYTAQISYILNEPATLGVTVNICSGTNVVRSFVATNGQPGALKGTNSFLWDGTDSLGSNAAPGLYTLQITAGAVGYADWTNINDVYEDNPRSIDVNKNVNSPYYGRVFVGNNDGNEPTDIFKYNADGSPADEGLVGTDGFNWDNGVGPEGFSPWKICVATNDTVYVNDWQGQGIVVEMDQLMDTNWSIALLSQNYPSDNASLGGLYFTGGATNGQLWMANIGLQYQPQGGVGILRWNLQDNGWAGTNDTGTNVVSDTNSDLNVAPFDLAIATNGYIYTIQRINETLATAAIDFVTNKLLCFPPSTNGAPPETTALWAVGANDTNLVNASGVDVDVTGSFVAVASRGFTSDGEYSTNGTVSIFDATDGDLVARFYSGQHHQVFDVAWDRVGNLYAADYGSNAWHVFSPPGANQASTTFCARIDLLSSLQPPTLSEASETTNGISFALEGQSDVTYVVQLSTNLLDWSDIATNFDTVPNRFFSLPPTTDAQDFYRAMVLPTH